MKRYLLFSLMLFFASAVNSQVLISILLGDKLNSDKLEFGLDGGLNFSNIHGLPNSNKLMGFNLGFYFDIKLKNPAWMFNTGVIVKSPMGAGELPVYSLNDPVLDNAFAGGSVARKLRYFNVPIMMKHSFSNHIYVKGGAQLGLRSKTFDEFSNQVIDKEDLKYKLNIRNEIHPLDAGLAFGLGYRLMGGNGMNIGLQYYLGLIDIVIDDASPRQYNRSLYITAGIPIGKSSRKKNE